MITAEHEQDAHNLRLILPLTQFRRLPRLSASLHNRDLRERTLSNLCPCAFEALAVLKSETRHYLIKRVNASTYTAP